MTVQTALYITRKTVLFILLRVKGITISSQHRFTIFQVENAPYLTFAAYKAAEMVCIFVLK